MKRFIIFSNTKVTELKSFKERYIMENTIKIYDSKIYGDGPNN